MGRPKQRLKPIRWKEGTHYRSYQPVDKDDADRFRVQLRERKQLGGRAPSLRDSQQTLIEFVENDWWPNHAAGLDEGTRQRYLGVWKVHIYDRIGYEPLAHIDMERVELFREDMKTAKVGAPTIIKAMHMLSSMLKRARKRRLIPENPVSDVEKPPQPARKPIRPLSPPTVELIREHMMLGWASQKRGAGRSPERLDWYRRRNAAMVTLLAYCGLRPSEMCRATWDDIVGERLHVSDKKRGRTKLREIDLLAPVTLDLAEWRMRCGRPAGGDLIVPTYDGDGWVTHDWANWRNRVYKPAAEAAGVRADDRDPYHLRHSFVSLLLWAGEDASYVAEQAGHSLRTQQDHYAGFMRELRGKEKMPAAEAIRLAREERSAARFGPSFRSGVTQK